MLWGERERKEREREREREREKKERDKERESERDLLEKPTTGKEWKFRQNFFFFSSQTQTTEEK